MAETIPLCSLLATYITVGESFVTNTNTNFVEITGELYFCIGVLSVSNKSFFDDWCNLYIIQR